MLAHVLTFFGLLIPLADLLLPWLVGRLSRESDYVRFHARSSLGFQASCLIYEVAFLALLGACYLAFESQQDGPHMVQVFLSLALVCLILLGLTWLFAAAGLVLYASMQALAGVRHCYPLTLRFLR